MKSIHESLDNVKTIREIRFSAIAWVCKSQMGLVQGSDIQSYNSEGIEESTALALRYLSIATYRHQAILVFSLNS